jgi:septum site-determining protein MinC
VDHPGDVVVLGHVNDGAEICAAGSVVVLGRLQGVVHAGVGGDDEAAVVARSLEAIQVRIGRKVGAMERGAPWWGKPALVSVEGDAVVVGDWPVLREGS